jgi:dienelactone hydrolase
MSVEKSTLKGIPVLVCHERRSQPSPVVILAHGFTGSKEDWRDRMPHLAARGYFVAALDNRDHGDRPRADFTGRACSNGKWNVLAIRQMIQETADDIRIVLNQILLQPGVDKDRIALAGVSMGAFSSLKAMVADRRIRVVVSILGSPYWDDIFEGTVEEGDLEALRRLNAFARHRQPASFQGRFFPRAVLLQVGELDRHINSRRVADIYRQMVKGYSNTPERWECVQYPGVAHEFTSQMWEQTLQWIDRFI